MDIYSRMTGEDGCEGWPHDETSWMSERMTVRTSISILSDTPEAMADHRPTHFAICSAGIFFSSFAFSFNVIGESVKSVFGLTQTQVELVSSMYFIGTGLNLVPGYYYDRLGARRTAVRGVYLTLLAWALVVGASLMAGQFQGRYVLLSILFLAAGHGRSFIVFPTMVSGLNTFSKTHRGKALAFLATLYTFGPLGPVLLFQMYFSGSQTLAEKRSNLSRFLAFLGVLLAVNGVLFCCSPAFSKTDASFSPKPKHSDENDVTASPKKIYSYFELLFRKDLILFAGSFAFVLGVGVAFETNVPFFAESLDIPSHSTFLIIIHRVCQGLARLLMGYFVDCIKSRCIRVLICASFATGSTVGLLMWSANSSSLTLLILASLLSGLARGVYGLINVLACEPYDIVNHGKIFGLSDTILAFAILCMQEAFGMFYVSAIGTESGTVCHGGKCLAKTGVFMGVACAVGTVSTILAAFRPIKQERCPVTR